MRTLGEVATWLTDLCSFRFSRNALLDYVEMVCKEVSKRFVKVRKEVSTCFSFTNLHADFCTILYRTTKPPEWWTPPTAEGPTPSLRKPDLKCFEDKSTGDSRYCVRCQEEVDEEERLKEEEREKEKSQVKDKLDAKQKARLRMKRKADEEKRKKQEKEAKRQKTK